MIIARYLIKEMLQTLFGVTLVLLLIFLSNQLIRYLKYAANGKISAGILVQLMGFEVPFLLGLILPLGLFLGIILTYGRLYTDNELRVMQASGLTQKKLLLITGFLGTSIALFVTGLMFFANPYFALKKNQLIAKSMASQNILDTLIPGRFQVSPDDKFVFYVESLSRNHKEAKNIFIAEQTTASTKTALPNWIVLSAADGYQMRDPGTKQRFVVAKDGFRYEGVPGQMAYKIIQFQAYAVRLLEQNLNLTHAPEETQGTRALLKNYTHPLKNAAEFQWRLALPIATFLLMLLALPLSYIKPRQNRYAHLFPALLIYVIYMNLLFLSRDWITHGTLNPDIGLWWVHGLLGLSICIVYYFQTPRIALRAFLRKFA
jgi:lipopolysaccharide export system permease protein